MLSPHMSNHMSKSSSGVNSLPRPDLIRPPEGYQRGKARFLTNLNFQIFPDKRPSLRSVFSQLGVAILGQIKPLPWNLSPHFAAAHRNRPLPSTAIVPPFPRAKYRVRDATTPLDSTRFP
jgi:hypothetical protein